MTVQVGVFAPYLSLALQDSGGCVIRLVSDDSFDRWYGTTLHTLYSLQNADRCVCAGQSQVP